jgi:hypothetical protein
VVVDAARIEPVSTPNSLANKGKEQGITRKSGYPLAISPPGQQAISMV